MNREQLEQLKDEVNQYLAQSTPYGAQTQAASILKKCHEAIGDFILHLDDEAENGRERDLLL